MGAVREEKDGVPHVVKAELLNGAFVPIPSNRESEVLSAKSYEAKASTEPVTLCAKCAEPTDPTHAPAPPADEAGKAPASNVVEFARLRATAALLAAND